MEEEFYTMAKVHIYSFKVENYVFIWCISLMMQHTEIRAFWVEHFLSCTMFPH